MTGGCLTEEAGDKIDAHYRLYLVAFTHALPLLRLFNIQYIHFSCRMNNV